MELSHGEAYPELKAFTAGCAAFVRRRRPRELQHCAAEEEVVGICSGRGLLGRLSMRGSGEEREKAGGPVREGERRGAW